MKTWCIRGDNRISSNRFYSPTVGSIVSERCTPLGGELLLLEGDEMLRIGTSLIGIETVSMVVRGDSLDCADGINDLLSGFRVCGWRRRRWIDSCRRLSLRDGRLLVNSVLVSVRDWGDGWFWVDFRLQQTDKTDKKTVRASEMHREIQSSNGKNDWRLHVCNRDVALSINDWVFDRSRLRGGNVRTWFTAGIIINRQKRIKPIANTNIRRMFCRNVLQENLIDLTTAIENLYWLLQLFPETCRNFLMLRTTCLRYFAGATPSEQITELSLP